MVDIVYVLGKGLSLKDDMEIRFSLRSLKNIKFDKVWIIGYKPRFVKDINFIECEDVFRDKQQNVINKILKVCENSEVSEEFLLMNDDFLFLKPQEIKCFCREDLDKMILGLNSKYAVATNNTIKFLTENNLPLVNYEVHYPMIFNKSKFKEIFSKVDWINHPYVYRSIYGNYLKIKAEQIIDFKAYTLEGFWAQYQREFLSTDNVLMCNIEAFKAIRKLFPEQGVYELNI